MTVRVRQHFARIAGPRIIGAGSFVALCISCVAVGCGAVAIEPLAPDEPLPEAAPPPRLVRKESAKVDGGTSDASSP